MKRDVERRYLTQPVEYRAATSGENGPGHLFGYAAKFNTLSQNLGGFVETIAPGAFDKSLADNVRVLCRFNHDDNALLGTTDAGTVKVGVDDTGLWYDVALPDTTWGRDTSTLAARGDVRNSSFAFYCARDDVGFTEQGYPLRTVLGAQLVDVAPVTSPAYLDTSVAKRSFAERIGVSMPEFDTMAPAEMRRRLISKFLTEQKRDLSTLSPATREALSKVLSLVANADEAVDLAQPLLADVLGVPNPDIEQDAEMQKNSDHGTPETRAQSVSDKAWSSFSQSDYTDEQWRRACLIVLNGGKTRADCKLPVREPDGTLNRNAVHAAASRINQTEAPQAEKVAAAKKLVSLYKNTLNETPPDSLTELAGRSYEPPETEQRETHSSLVVVRRLQLALDALR